MARRVLLGKGKFREDGGVKKGASRQHGDGSLYQLRRAGEDRKGDKEILEIYTNGNRENSRQHGGWNR